MGLLEVEPGLRRPAAALDPGLGAQLVPHHLVQHRRDPIDQLGQKQHHQTSRGAHQQHQHQRHQGHLTGQAPGHVGPQKAQNGGHGDHRQGHIRRRGGRKDQRQEGQHGQRAGLASLDVGKCQTRQEHEQRQREGGPPRGLGKRATDARQTSHGVINKDRVARIAHVRQQGGQVQVPLTQVQRHGHHVEPAQHDHGVCQPAHAQTVRQHQAHAEKNSQPRQQIDRLRDVGAERLQRHLAHRRGIGRRPVGHEHGRVTRKQPRQQIGRQRAVKHQQDQPEPGVRHPKRLTQQMRRTIMQRPPQQKRHHEHRRQHRGPAERQCRRGAEQAAREEDRQDVVLPGAQPDEQQDEGEGRDHGRLRIRG